MSCPDAELINQLSRSQIYRDYEKAFSLATELPLSLRPPKSLSLAHHGRANENPFCALLAKSHKGCQACLEMQEKLGGSDGEKTANATCFAGLCDTAVPVKVGDRLVGFLQTGQVATQEPTQKKFSQIAEKIIKWGSNVDLRQLEEAYFHSQVLSPKQYAGVIRLLEIFASHLAELSNQLVIQEESAESPFAKRAKAYVADHMADPITLDEVSRSLNVSTFYFCKMFKKATGLTFTDYLSRVRIERAKAMLLNPHHRISEVAFEVGFGSLTHFNRVFRRIVGQSPTDYREEHAHAH